MLMKRNFLAETFAAIAILALPQVAMSFTIDSTTAVNDSFDVAWELSGLDNPTGLDLSGNASFEVLNIETVGSSTQLQFGLTLENTTVANNNVTGSGNYSNIALSSFGFGGNFAVPSWSVPGWGANGSGGGIGPGGGSKGPSDGGEVEFVGAINPFDPYSDPAFPSDAPNLNDPALGSQVECLQLPTNAEQVECIKVVAVTATGAGDPGLGAGASDSFEFTLDLGQILAPGTQLTVNPFAASYSYDDPNDNGNRAQIVVGANEIPLPGSLLLMGIGALALRRFVRRA